jgi:membrane-associated phospholipid phosphatase
MRACLAPTAGRSISSAVEAVRHGRARLAGAAALLIVMMTIALLVDAGRAEALDIALLNGIGRIVGASELVLQLASSLTDLGDAVTRFTIAGVIALALWLGSRWREAVFLVVAVPGGALFNTMLKTIFGRDRPDLLPQLDIVHSLSFPSGHSAGAAALWLAVALVARRSGCPAIPAFALAILFAAGIGLSRIALAVHWPSDVLAGWCVGAAWFLLSAELLARADRRLQGRDQAMTAPTAG